MRILSWHVHGAWSTSFVQGDHDYLVPVVPGRGPEGRGRASTYPWPDRVVEVTPEELRDAEIDAVVLQRPSEIGLCRQWTDRTPGRDLAAVYVEHNTPKGPPAQTVHPVVHHPGIELVHVTHFNALFWDGGSTPTRVIEHGVPDPGNLWTGELGRAAIVCNEPVRRHRITGSDLIGDIAAAVPVDVFGMGLQGLHERYGLDPNRVTLHEDLPQAELHKQMAQRAVYVHLTRWTSLGLSLIEAMHLGMPVVALATTDAHRAVVPGAGHLATDMAQIRAAVARYAADREVAAEAGRVARATALTRFGLARFLSDWDRLLEEVAA